MAVLSNQLPLKLNETVVPSPNTLYFKLGDTSNNATVINSSTLPLPLRPVVDYPPSDQLPLTLGVDNSTPIKPPEPIKPRRTYTIAACLTATTSKSVSINKTAQVKSDKSHTVASQQQISNKKTTTIAKCQQLLSPQLTQISNCQRVESTRLMQISRQLNLHNERLILISRCQYVLNSKAVNINRYLHVNTSKAYRLNRCQSAVTPQSIKLIKCAEVGSQLAINITNSQIAASLTAIPIPCRYYPIPEPPPETPKFSCRPRPPSSQLPLNLSRRGNIPSSNLPLRLMCWHDEPPPFIPNLRTYIMHHTITATIGDISVDPLEFSVKSSMDGAYRQCSIGLSDDDYERVKHLIKVKVGNEPIVSVIVNGDEFVFIGETPVRSRSFANFSHGLEGRSVTARLGADYMSANNRLFDKASYASQLMRQQLQNLPFTLEFGIEQDWLIPANTYSVANKTPIAVIAEIADAAGAYIESHAYEPILTVKPRWTKPAWELSSATPDVTIPADLIITDKTRTQKNPRYNNVMLAGNTYLDHVFRQVQSRDREAPMQKNALYTDQVVTNAKGKAVLSDSGTHEIYPLKLPWSNDVLPLAATGQIWRVNDIDGTWQGVVVSVEGTVEVVDDAPEPYQTVTIDRYLDD